MLDHFVKIAKHIRPELVAKWLGIAGIAFVSAIVYDIGTKGDDIFFEDGEYDWLVDGVNNTSEEELYAVGQDEPYLKLKVEE